VVAHRARRLQPADVDRADLVLCADRANVSAVRTIAGAGTDLSKIRLLGSFDAEADPGLVEVPDPWSGDDADFDEALELIERACRGLVESLVISVG
jgi:protein-tyrosine phosphatase